MLKNVTTFIALLYYKQAKQLTNFCHAVSRNWFKTSLNQQNFEVVVQ